MKYVHKDENAPSKTVSPHCEAQNQLFLPFFTVGYPDTNEYNVHGYQTTADTYYSYQDLSPYDSYHKVYADTK